MSNEVEVVKFFQVPAKELFNYFIEPSLLEKWSYPDGMTLKIPVFEAREGGKYRYEHSNEKGTYICEGHIEKIVPAVSMRMTDDWIKTPDGSMSGENLSCEITFKPLGEYCEVTVRQSGFRDERFARECEQGWTQCFDRLQDLTASSNLKSHQSLSNKNSSQSEGSSWK